MMILGVTGGIACGKSTAVTILAQAGAVVVSADDLARRLVQPGSPVLRQLVERFGQRIVAADGSLDRSELGRIIFKDDAARRDLDAIMHPAIAALSRQELERARQRAEAAATIVVYEAPLLFEAGAEERVDKVLVISVDEQIQLQRLMARDQCDETTARQRIAAHMAQKEKIRRADYVIDNSGDMVTLRRTVLELYRELLE